MTTSNKIGALAMALVLGFMLGMALSPGRYTPSQAAAVVDREVESMRYYKQTQCIGVAKRISRKIRELGK